MPRKPKPPAPMVIEGLSTGEVMNAQTQFVDDIAGNPQPVYAVTQSHKRAVPPSAEEMRKAMKARAMATSTLRNVTLVIDPSAGTLHLQRPSREVIPKGKRKIGELNGKAVLLTNEPWRRI